MVFSLPAHLRLTRCVQLSPDQTPNKPYQTPTRPYQIPTEPLPDLCQTLPALPDLGRSHASLPPDLYQTLTRPY